MSYLQSLLDHLDDYNLLTSELEKQIIEHYNIFNSKPSVKMPFGAHKGKTLREIHDFKPAYIEWLVKQSYIKEKFTDIFQECKQLLE